MICFEGFVICVNVFDHKLHGIFAIEARNSKMIT